MQSDQLMSFMRVSHSYTSPEARSESRHARGILRTVQALPDMILRWQDRMAQRRQLAGMSERLLKDIGVSHADAAHEVAKPFWRD